MTSKEAEQTLSLIRTLMERSACYTNLSGHAGIAASVATFVGCAMRSWYNTPFLSTWIGVLLAAAGAAWLVLSSLGPHVALAASPGTTVLPGADTRSSGEGPGLVGDPGLAILLVLAIAVVAVAGTIVYVRLTGGPRHQG